MSVTIYHRLTSTNRIDSRRELPPTQPVGQSNICWGQSEKEKGHTSALKHWINIPVLIQLMLAANLWRSHHVCLQTNSQSSRWSSHLNCTAADSSLKDAIWFDAYLCSHEHVAGGLCDTVHFGLLALRALEGQLCQDCLQLIDGANLHVKVHQS